MAYVPPALRKAKYTDVRLSESSDRSAPKSAGNNDGRQSCDPLPSGVDIHAYLWPAEIGVEDDADKDKPSSYSTTLHASAANPDRLKFVLLFKDANPRWQSDQIIFVKSNLDLLPSVASVDANNTDNDDKTNEEDVTTTQAPDHIDSEISPSKQAAKEEPVLIFEQSSRSSYTGGTFTFSGYYQIQKIQYLEPDTPDLARMLDQKWTRTNKYGREIQRQRDSEAWKKSLRQRWAVIKFEKDDDAEVNFGKPDIKVSMPNKSRGHTTKRSVNELLQEMRLGNSGVDAK